MLHLFQYNESYLKWNDHRFTFQTKHSLLPHKGGGRGGGGGTVEFKTKAFMACLRMSISDFVAIQQRINDMEKKTYPKHAIVTELQSFGVSSTLGEMMAELFQFTFAGLMNNNPTCAPVVFFVDDDDKLDTHHVLVLSFPEGSPPQIRRFHAWDLSDKMEILPKRYLYISLERCSELKLLFNV